MRTLWNTCLLLYTESGCWEKEEVIKLEEMWVKQAVSETEVYGDMLICNVTKQVFNMTEITRIKTMVEDKEHWRHKSRY